MAKEQQTAVVAQTVMLPIEAAAEKAAALRWELSERERAIVKKLPSK